MCVHLMEVMVMNISASVKVQIRRQWNDWRIGEVELSQLDDLHWDSVSGGVHAPAPRPFIHAYVKCTDVEGDISHSGAHGECPHRIKVVLVKKDNSRVVWDKVLSIVSSKRSY